jgi:hypothetical protein
MDIIDKFRAQWDNPEFEQKYARLVPETPEEAIKRMKSLRWRIKRWRPTRRIIIKAASLLPIIKKCILC